MLWVPVIRLITINISWNLQKFFEKASIFKMCSVDSDLFFVFFFEIGKNPENWHICLYICISQTNKLIYQLKKIDGEYSRQFFLICV